MAGTTVSPRPASVCASVCSFTSGAAAICRAQQVPSTTELAAFHRINPATAAKGVNQLVADGVLHKKRGIGMFVTDGARVLLVDRRRNRFANEFVEPLIAEARKLGIDLDELKTMIDKKEGDR